ncbi:hypothetical protein VitviT2T_000087 [Vitis vinifera]|uniref:Pentatricopeptide repeat-containing protein n=3 Tax=Vitis vinifera TaxID=29760 RepID=A0ABY9BCV5_VITVI|nr:pentatricopeptide repeat-containing protein At4g11690 [Vitis vinifera]XP_019077536.1 pentatricopeptide repeat-containing protein At4g11690 [Vitis vinifera]WJZ80150.1 hypothetical protein VitviT2T_000087 [Vitis vinifera]|eukprot:XP_003631195.2 PREDICTED: pentatricopeptide repeat-containing protein At4g11690-like [Vitis vinifera]
MKPLQRSLFVSAPSLPSNPISLLFSTLSSSSSSSSSAAAEVAAAAAAKKHIDLTPEELTKISLLIPRLCSSNQLPTAIRLVDASFLANPPLESLSLRILIDRLTSEPDMTQPMALLTRLKHNQFAHYSLRPITTLLISSYFKKRRPKEAFKVFNWMSRPDSHCTPHVAAYSLLVHGFCRNGFVLEALKVLRAMVGADMAPAADLRTRVYRSLLREARIGEAKELDAVLRCVGDGGEGFGKVANLLDRMIGNWVE